MMTDVRRRARDETRRYIRRIASLILQAHLTALEADQIFDLLPRIDIRRPC